MKWLEEKLYNLEKKKTQRVIKRKQHLEQEQMKLKTQ